MALLSIPRKREIQGPWLIGQAELEELDAIIDTLDQFLSKALDEQINHEIKIASEKDQYFSESKQLKKIKELREAHLEETQKRITIVFKDDKKLSDTSLKGILKDVQLQDLKPKSILIRIQHGSENSFRFELTTIDEGTLRYQLTGFDDEMLDEAKYQIDKWIEKYKPNKLHQTWSQNALAGLLGLAVFVMFIYIQPEQVTPNVKELYRQQTYDLIKQGLSKENHDKAVEMILKLQSEYLPENFQAQTVYASKQEIRIFVILCVLFVFSIIKPITTIGIGKSKNLLEFYKFWKKFALGAVPGTFVVPYIFEYIKAIL